MSEISVSNTFLEPQPDTLAEEQASIPVIGGAILKSTARCDYACRHCYVFESADQTWQVLPRKMEDATIARVGERIAEHVERHDLPSFHVVLHGGEPFLFGKKHTQRIVEGIRASTRDATYVEFSAHSNARLLGLGNDRSKEMLDYLEEANIGVSTSLDGDQRANDFYRLYRDGSSTYEDTVMGVRALKERGLLRGILAVMILGDIDFKRPAEDVISAIKQRGVDTYDALCEFEPKTIDFLFPLGHRGDLPPGMTTREERAMLPYANWLEPVFDKWYSVAEHKLFDPTSVMARQYAPNVRTFTSIVNRYQGKPTSVETIGALGEVTSVVIDSDGQYGIVDTLASAAEGEYRLDMSVHDATIDHAAQTVMQKASAQGMMTLPEECGGCPVRTICQGGYVPHRYDPYARNEQLPYGKKSIYSSNLLKLISHISGSVYASQIHYAGIRSQRNYYGESFDSIAF